MRFVLLLIIALFSRRPLSPAWAVEWYESGPAAVPGEPADNGPGTRGWRISIIRENEDDLETESRSLYSDGELHSSVILRRSEGQLLSREERDASGGLIVRVEYSYDMEGNPRASYIESGIDLKSGPEGDSEPGLEFGSGGDSESGLESGSEGDSEAGLESGSEGDSEPGLEFGSGGDSESGLESGSEGDSEPGLEFGPGGDSESGLGAGPEDDSESGPGGDSEAGLESGPGGDSESGPGGDSEPGLESGPEGDSEAGLESGPEGDSEAGLESGVLRVEFEGGIHPDGTVYRHQSGSGGDWVITDFDGGGYPLRWVSIENGEAAREVLWRRTEEGLPLESRLRDGKDLRISLYDEQGRLVREETRRDGYLIFTRTYSWADGDLVRVEERGEGRLRVREIEWEQERIAREVRLVNGLKQSETEWSSSDRRTETRYRDGKAVIRSYWVNDILQKEEFLRDGEVVRVQTRDSAGDDR